MVAEESEPDYDILWRGTVSSTQQLHDLAQIEESLPPWILEYLLLNKLPASVVPPAKISFVMCPYIFKEGEQGDQLPELLNTCVLGRP